jgi:hypothetical protein
MHPATVAKLLAEGGIFKGVVALLVRIAISRYGVPEEQTKSG